MLDEWRLAEWLELVDPDFTYQIPVPLLSDQPDQLGYDPRALFMDETRESIDENWAARLTEKHRTVSWADFPPVRIKRFLSALRVRETERPDELLARVNVRAAIFRQDTQSGEMVGERFDLLRRSQEGFILMSRFVTLSSVVLDVPRLRIIL